MNNEEKFYAKKFLKESSNLFEKEINILNTLKSANNQNIVNIISSGEGLIKRKNHPEQKSQSGIDRIPLPLRYA